MKVLFVNLVYPVGSTGSIIDDITKILIKSNHDVKVLYGTGEKSKVPYATRTSGKFEYYFHNYFSRITDHAGLYSYFATFRLIYEIKKFSPDIIHLHTFHGFYVNYKMLFRFLKEADIPVIWTLHDCWAFTGHCTNYEQADCMRWKTQCYDCPLNFRYPMCYFKGDAKHNYKLKKQTFNGVKNLTLTVPSNWLAEQVSNSFLSKYPLEIIPNGVDTDVFYPRSTDIRNKYHLNDKFIVLGVANSWSDRKGLNDFYVLANHLGDDYQVVLIGLTEKQLNNLPDNILGIMRTHDRDELAQWYSAANVFVNPTYEETFGMTTIEAQACGTPVAIYRTGGCPETVSEGNGILVKKGDLNALEIAVKTIVNNGKPIQTQKNSCFDKKRVYDMYINLYKRML